MTLKEFFADHPRVAIAFSGGVDSAYLLYGACQAGAQVRAYYARSPFQPRFEYEDACRLARELEVALVEVKVDVLASPAISANPPDRCYHCKRAIFAAILSAARADGFSVLLDGTNASDDLSDRPGVRALEEYGVLSPLRLCGLTKGEIRNLSRQAGLFTWDKPAYACLATRIPTGTPITREDLARTEWAENYLFSLGLRDFRVRLLGEGARLQVTAGDVPMVMAHREEIVKALKQRYRFALLDLEVRDEH